MAAAYACTHEHPFSALFGGIAADMEAATHQQRACHGRCGAGIRSFPPGRNACHAGSPSAAGSPAAGSRLIRLNVLEHKDAFEVQADLPGVNKDAISVKTEDDSVTISVAPPKAEAAEAPGGNGGSHTAAGVPKVLQSECFSRRYAPRTLPLSRQADLSQLAAKYVDGVLHVTAPKRAVAQPHTILVE